MSGSRRCARAAPKAIRQPSVGAHGRHLVSTCLKELEIVSGARTVARQSQSHEALVPHLSVNATAHFGAQRFPSRLLSVENLYDIGILLAPRIRRQTHPGHAGGREDPARIVYARASAHAYGGARRRHARAGGCAQELWACCAADTAQACVLRWQLALFSAISAPRFSVGPCVIRYRADQSMRY